MAKSSMLAGLKWNFLYMIHFIIIPPTALMYYYNSQVDYSSRYYDLQLAYIFDISLRAIPQTYVIFLNFIILITFCHMYNVPYYAIIFCRELLLCIFGPNFLPSTLFPNTLNNPQNK